MLAALIGGRAPSPSPAARADGDPASDYLITQPVFFPFESKASAAAQKELTALLADAKKKGFGVRVALIATRADLGAVPVLYGKPQRYANFLGQELVYYYKGPLLIVMPNGYGIYKSGAALPEDKQLLAQLAAARLDRRQRDRGRRGERRPRARAPPRAHPPRRRRRSKGSSGQPRPAEDRRGRDPRLRRRPSAYGSCSVAAGREPPMRRHSLTFGVLLARRRGDDGLCRKRREVGVLPRHAVGRDRRRRRTSCSTTSTAAASRSRASAATGRSSRSSTPRAPTCAR